MVDRQNPLHPDNRKIMENGQLTTPFKPQLTHIAPKIHASNTKFLHATTP